jgi:flagellar assembly protein FliH
MATVIKATDRNQGVQGVLFNFDDVAAKANQYLEKVRAEAAEILARARQEAMAIRQKIEKDSRDAGYEAGRQAGLKEIEKMVEERLAAQLATLRPALAKAIQDIQHAKQAWLRHWEKSAVHLAAAIASRVIRREVARTPEISLTLMRETLELAAGATQVRVHLNPRDYEALKPRAESLAKELCGLAPSQIVADPCVTPGGCRVETAFGTIDQQIEAQLARIEEELT